MLDLTPLVPSASEPFFVVSPPATSYSVLRLLCHQLNAVGENAFLIHFPPAVVPTHRLPHYVQLQSAVGFEPTLSAPFLTEDVIDYYHQRKIGPVVIYPENLDNPLKVKFFGKYILNRLAKVSATFKEREAFSIPYTTTLANYWGNTHPDRPKPFQPIFVPPTDLSFWTEGQSSDRSATCYFAETLKTIHHQEPHGIPIGSIEIKSTEQMTKAEIRSVFQRSKAFYCYEDSALAVAAALCGCPTVFVANEYFSGEPAAAVETEFCGWCRSDDYEVLERARLSISRMRPTLQSHANAFPALVKDMAARAKDLVRQHDYSGTISYPYKPKLVFFERDISFDDSVVPPPEELNEMNVRFGADRSSGVAIRPDIIRDIAREVWFERQRWGFFYKLGKRLSRIGRHLKSRFASVS